MWGLASPTKAKGPASEPAVLKSGTYSTDMHACEHQDTYRRLFITSFSVITLNWKQANVQQQQHSFKNYDAVHKREELVLSNCGAGEDS